MQELRIARSASALGLLVALLLPWTAFADDDDDDSSETRRIEEMVIYGERIESTVSDTSIAITAMDEDFLKDMGMQGPNEMVNFIPATTRTDWDIKIRGIGRNFRGLGGDPGVGTYYNGIYSPDFGIASTEGGLFDIKRIEVLRGPQGTLYGRNSVGGVVNYVTNQPNHEGFEANVRAIFGEYNTNEWYGVVSGPLTQDMAYRFTGVKRLRGPAVEGLAGSEDVEDLNDQNFAFIFEWNILDNLTANMRINDRRAYSKRNFGNGGHGIAGEGPCIGTHPITSDSQCDPRYRVPRDTNHYATGFRPVDQAWRDQYGDLADDPRGAVGFIHPVTGETVWGAYNRPGVDPAIRFPHMPSQNYMQDSVASYDIGDADAPDIVALTTNDNREEFDHQQGSLVVDWEMSETLAAKYLGSYQSFAYWFNRDNNFSDGHISDIDDTVVEQVESWSHEIRLFWQVGERFTATSGVYQFWESRDQWYGIRERAAQGRATLPARYGAEEYALFNSFAFAWLPGCDTFPLGPGGGAGRELNAVAGGFSRYCGDPGDPYGQRKGTGDTGAVYEQMNTVDNENLAFYTQGDITLTDTMSLTLGARYSKDWRDAIEGRGGYSEITAAPWMTGIFRQVCALGVPCPMTLEELDAPGVTDLAALNVALGAARFTGDPDFPIEPVCDLTARDCDHPLRLAGMPIGWGYRTSGTYKEEGNWTYRVNFNWEPNSDMLVYFGVTTGYRAGGFNLGGPENRIEIGDRRILSQYEGEELTSWELGYKGSHFDGTLQLDFAVYHYDYTNYQTQVRSWESSSANVNLSGVVLSDGTRPDRPGGRGAVDIVTNIPEAYNRGFEINALYLVTDDFNVGGNYSYTKSVFDAEFTFFNDQDPRYPIDVFAGINLVDANSDPCTLPPEIRELYCLTANGIELTGIPKHKATVWAAYNWKLPNGLLTWNSSLSYTGEYSTHEFRRPWDLVPERERLDTRLTYRADSGAWAVSAFIDNVLDKTYIRHTDMENRRTGYGPNWPQRVVSLYPRYWGVEFEYSMGAFR